MSNDNPVSVLFICMGNICRSPTAHGVFENFVTRWGVSDLISVDSAGTHSYHIGHPPDLRAQAAAKRRGYDLSNQRAQKLTAALASKSDYILVMDDTNYHDAIDIVDYEDRDKIQYLLEYSESVSRFVPDPYYGGEDGFEQVLDLVEGACENLLDAIVDTRGLRPNEAEPKDESDGSDSD